MERKAYSAGAVKECFWFSEFRKVVALLSEGHSMEEVKELNRRENIFLAPTPERGKQIFSTVSARVNSLDSSFYPLFLGGDLATQKLFALAGAMEYDSLFFDFVYEVIREKMMLGTDELTDSDVRRFFRNKQVQDEKAAGWTDATLRRLGGCYRTMLSEAGVLERAKHTRRIFRPLLMPEFHRWLEEHGMGAFINALTGVGS